MIERKKIEMQKAKEVMARFNELPSQIITAREFIDMHFDELQKSGQPLKVLHDFLTSNGVDVGTLKSFRSTYSRVKRDRKNKPTAPLPKAPEPERAVSAEIQPSEHVSPAPPEHAQESVKAASAKVGVPKGANAEKVKDTSPGVKVIRLADGTPIEVDLETGGRTFNF